MALCGLEFNVFGAAAYSMRSCSFFGALTGPGCEELGRVCPTMYVVAQCSRGGELFIGMGFKVGEV